MRLRSIEYFLAIVQEGSFSAAAEKLYISQSALSQQIKKLERELGGTLFDRSKHTAELTDVGALFVEDGGQILQIYQHTLHRIREIQDPAAGMVRFGISPFYSRYYLPSILPPLHRQYPDIKYEVVEDYSGKLEALLLERKLDFALVPSLPENPKLEYKPVFLEEILLAVNRHNPVNRFSTPGPAGGLPYMALGEMRREPFIILKEVQKVSALCLSLCEQAGFQANVVCETMNWDTLNMLVANGLGVGFVPDLLINTIEESIRPRYYRLNPSVHRAYSVAYPKGITINLLANRVIESFRESFRSIRVPRAI